MTIVKLYRCNLCASSLAPENLVGLSWESSGKCVPKLAQSVENHICRRCLGDIRGWQFPDSAGGNDAD